MLFYMFWNLHLAALPCGEGWELGGGGAHNMEMRTLSFWNTMTSLCLPSELLYMWQIDFYEN